MANLQVRKRDGSIQQFSRSKLEQSVRKAGLSPIVAAVVAKKAEENLSIIPSSAIREWVSAELWRHNPAAAKAYDSFKKKKAASRKK